MDNDDRKLAAPYIPFLTFLNALDHLKAIGVPNIIDREVFPSFSGTMQKQLLNSFKFLALIDASGIPTPNLAALIGLNDRKVVLKKIIQQQYAELIALDLTKVSPSQFDYMLEEYGVGGATLRKAKSFFLKAAQYADLPLSPLLTRITRNRGNGTRRRKIPAEAKKVVKPPLDVNQPTGTSKQITLACGGELTLQLSVNLFDLHGKDREFVFGLIDKIQQYETGNK